MKRKKGVKNKSDNKWSIHEMFFGSLKFIKQNLSYIYFIFSLFLLFMLVGFLFPSFFEEQIIEMIKGIIEKTEGLNAIELAGFIFMNNTLSGFFAVILGILFGIFPLITIIINGYVIGFVMNAAVAEEGVLILWRLIPHGIFEIPAIMISAGLGLKIGFSLISDFVKKIKGISKNMVYPLIFILIVFSIFSFIPVLIMSFIDKSLRKKFSDNFWQSVKAFVFIVIPLLIIAAIIEGILIHFLG
tara:strand:- start:2 stop:730 length:729 start_codon:yes stop_codon:yes gene_type:complete